MLHLFVYLCFQLIKPIFIEIFFFVNRFNHVEAQEPVTLFCFILDIYKSNQRMKHTIRFVLACRFHYHNKPKIEISRWDCSFKYERISLRRWNYSNNATKTSQ